MKKTIEGCTGPGGAAGACGREVFARGLCGSHYKMARRLGGKLLPLRRRSAPGARLEAFTVRVSPATWKKLGDSPGLRAAAVLERWPRIRALLRRAGELEGKPLDPDERGEARRLLGDT